MILVSSPLFRTFRDSRPACDAVVHCAAWVEPWGSREDYWRANVEGTDRLLAAARSAGAARFLHMSTEAVLWRGQHLRDVDETHPYPDRTPYLYAETKAAMDAAEAMAPEGAFRGCEAPIPGWCHVDIPNELYEAVRTLHPKSKPPFRSRPFDVQIIGAMVLSEGKIAEMKTGRASISAAL